MLSYTSCFILLFFKTVFLLHTALILVVSPVVTSANLK